MRLSSLTWKMEETITTVIVAKDQRDDKQNTFSMMPDTQRALDEDYIACFLFSFLAFSLGRVFIKSRGNVSFGIKYG